MCNLWLKSAWCHFQPAPQGILPFYSPIAKAKNRDILRGRRPKGQCITIQLSLHPNCHNLLSPILAFNLLSAPAIPRFLTLIYWRPSSTKWLPNEASQPLRPRLHPIFAVRIECTTLSSQWKTTLGISLWQTKTAKTTLWKSQFITARPSSPHRFVSRRPKWFPGTVVVFLIWAGLPLRSYIALWRGSARLCKLYGHD